MHSYGFLIDQIALRLYPNGIKPTSPVQREDIRAAIEQKINYLYKGVQFNEVYQSGETIPSNAFLMTFENITVKSRRDGRSECTLPAMPINLPRNMGVFEISPFFPDDEEDVFYPNFQLSSLLTNAISDIEDVSAVSGGHIISDGNADIIAKGVCWNIAPTPTILNNRTIDGNDSTDFISNITGLTAGQTYFVRAYATNAKGTAYGNQVSFVAVSPIIDDFMQAKVTLSSAQILALNTTPVILVAAQGSGKYIRYLASSIKATGGTTPYGSSITPIIKAGILIEGILSGAFNQATGGISNYTAGSAGTSDFTTVDNQPLVITSLAAFSGGDQSYDVYITYVIVTL